MELVEKDKIKVGTVLSNVALTEKEMGRKIHCHFMAVELFLKRCKNKYDIIFLDPPFPYRYHQSLIEMVSKGELLTPGGVVLIHRPKEKEMPDSVLQLKLADRREYGRSIVDFYVNNS